MVSEGRLFSLMVLYIIYYPDARSMKFDIKTYYNHQGPVADSCEHCNEPSGLMEGGGFLYLLSDY
jgi:hypothetical protein